MFLDMSSKHLAFLSFQIHHMRQRGTIFHTTALQDLPPTHQVAYNSLTLPSITQHNPNRMKIAFHKVRATPQVATRVQALVAGCDDRHVLWWPECSMGAEKVAAAIEKKCFQRLMFLLSVVARKVAASIEKKCFRRFDVFVVEK
jgi:hypothetical protein